MADYQRSFSFNQGDLGAHLAVIDDQINDFIDNTMEEAAAEGEKTMKAEAPWRDRTRDARSGLWAGTYASGNKRILDMGHSVSYGVYLEERWGGRYQVVMPVLVRTGRAVMRSLEDMFAEMEARMPAAPVIEGAGEGFRQGTSQGLSERGRAAKAKTKAKTRKAVVRFRDSLGRFVSTKGNTDITPRSKRTGRR